MPENMQDVRSDLLEMIRSASETASQMRIGQLVAVIGDLCADMHGRGLGDATDEELLEAAWRFRHDFEHAINGHSAF